MRGLVLEGGGVKGSYQIGAYYAFRDCGIKFDGFVGTSIGSFNAVMLASNMEKELLRFWYTVDPGTLLGMDSRFVELFNDQELDINGLKGAFSSLAKFVKNFGLDNKELLSTVQKIVNFDTLIKSPKDFGLVTVRVSHEGIKPLYVYKENIPNQDKLIEYLMASCYLPVFREKRIIDNHYYIDGGFYDNSPVKLLKDKGYNEVYVINIKGIGINRSLHTNLKTHIITPSRDNGSVLELNREVIKNNILMGYYDTVKYIKKLDGKYYCFKKRPNWYYNLLSRKVPKRLQKRVQNFFKTTNNHDTIITALEYVLEKENISYYDIYNPYKEIKKLKKLNNNHFVYKYLKELRFI